MPGLRTGRAVVAMVAASFTLSAPVPATWRPSGARSASDELAGSIASVKVNTNWGGDEVMLALAAGTDVTSSAWPNAAGWKVMRASRARGAATAMVRTRSAGSVLREEGVIAVALEPSAAHETEGCDDDRLGSARRHDGRQARPDLLGTLDAQQREVVADALCRRLALAPHRDQHVGLVLQGS